MSTSTEAAIQYVPRRQLYYSLQGLKFANKNQLYHILIQIALLLLSPHASLLNISNPFSGSSYFNISWLYYAQDYNETITFALQNNPSYTQIDDVSVLYGTQQLLCNSGFENASMICCQGVNHLSGSNPHNGLYCYNDGVVGSPDYVWQTFNTVPGALLYISF